MKNDPLTGTLLGVLAFSALFSISCFYLTVGKNRELRQMQPQMNAISGNANLFNALAMEVREYAKKNPGIEPSLQNNMLWKNISAAGKTPTK